MPGNKRISRGTPHSNVVNELVLLNERLSNMNHDINENHAVTKKELEKLDRIISGDDGNAALGLIVRVDRIEQHVAANQKRSTTAFNAAMAGVILAVITFLGGLISLGFAVLTKGHP